MTSTGTGQITEEVFLQQEDIGCQACIWIFEYVFFHLNALLWPILNMWKKLLKRSYWTDQVKHLQKIYRFYQRKFVSFLSCVSFPKAQS